MRVRGAAAGRPDARRLQRRRRRGLRRAQRRHRRAAAVGRRDHRAASAAAARAGRAACDSYIAHGADGAALPADDDRSRATTSSPRTATSSPATTSSGRSCRSRSTARSGAADRPPFPLLQPRRCCRCRCSCGSTRDYRYRLAGTERVGELRLLRRPVRAGRATAQSLYRGTVWIDRADVRARPRAGGAERPVGAGRLERGDPDATRRSTSIGNRPVFLFTGLTARQIMLIAGRNLLVEKRVAFSDFRVNDAGLRRARAPRRARSDRDHVPRDRSRAALLRQGGGRRASSASAPTPARRAMAMGVTLDPSYAFPLPIFGINYLDFEFGGRPTRSSRCSSPACSRPATSSGRSSASTPFDASVDFFAHRGAVERSALRRRRRARRASGC